jgi:ferredoxin
MAFKITEDCIACGACEFECPNKAISAGDPNYVINPKLCTECYGFHAEQQCALVCPVEAPKPDPDIKESVEDLLAKFKESHPGEDPKETKNWSSPSQN